LPVSAAPLKAVRRSAWPSVSLRRPKPGARSSLLWAEAQGWEGASPLAPRWQAIGAVEGAFLVGERARATSSCRGRAGNHYP
jgi:hypothetical protein